LPGFITIAPPRAHGGVQNYSSAFLPAIYQGTAIGTADVPVKDASIPFLSNDELSPALQRRQLDLIQRLNRSHLRRSDDDAQVEGMVQSYELAFRMQSAAPSVLELSRESEATLKLYGIGTPETDDFGRQCLMARRFAESGVRFIQISTGYLWDQHEKLVSGHEKIARAVDRPISGLLTGLKARGLLEDTLVFWGAEFGRTPYTEGLDGRDHNPEGYSVWLAGGGVKGGLAYGKTDEFGFAAVEDKVHYHDLHATIPLPAGPGPRAVDLSLFRPRFPPDRHLRPGHPRHPCLTDRLGPWAGRGLPARHPPGNGVRVLPFGPESP
jgi:uncharacterized protein (DUF1501 family)